MFGINQNSHGLAPSTDNGVLTQPTPLKGAFIMNFILEWRVSPEHVKLLPDAGKVPNLPISTVAPQLHDLVQLSDGRYWRVFVRLWEPAGQDYKLVLMVEPAIDTPDMTGHTMH